MLTLLVLGSPQDRSLHPVRELEDVRVGLGTDAAAIAESLGGFEAVQEAEVLLVARARRETLAEVLAHAPRLRWVHARSAGIDHLVSPALLAAPIVMTNGKGTFSASLAEFALAGILHFLKDIPRMQRAKAARRWEPYEPDALGGKTLGLVGYGDIGRAVAQRARAFDMTVLAVRRRATTEHDELGVRFLVGPGALEDLMRASDAVVVATALTPETRGLVSAEAIAALRPQAVLVNVARGAVLDEPALVEALRARRLRGAVLDVFSEEPLPPDHPLWALDNVLLSPHCADNVPGSLDSAMAAFLDNLARFRRGEPLRNRVDLARGY
jgi:phosphoglycerate dehydrogenase-like enzyme